MCKAWEDSRKVAEKQGMRQGVKQGVKQGMRQGVKQGETRLADLMGKLLEEGRTEEARLAARDKAARKKLYREYGIAMESRPMSSV